MFKILIFIFLFLKTLVFSSEFEIELDPYYTNIGYYLDIGEKEENLGKRSEFEIYSYLLKNIYRPKTLVLESSFNPLPYILECLIWDAQCQCRDFTWFFRYKLDCITGKISCPDLEIGNCQRHPCLIAVYDFAGPLIMPVGKSFDQF